MFSLPSLAFPVPSFLRPRGTSIIDIAPVETHGVETKSDKRARALKYLLKLNHANHSILYHNLQYDNHVPHLLGSAYLLGADEDRLEALYERESEVLEKWQDSPAEVSKHDWRDYLGDPRYQRAYVDFFEDELALNGYDWEKVLDLYMFQGEEPLANGLIAGLAHPIIHLGYAYELSSKDLAMEALGLAATSYNFLHKYLDDSVYSKTSTISTTSTLALLKKIADDERFDSLPDYHDIEDAMESLFNSHENLMLEYWNAWALNDPKEQFKESQFAAASLLAGTQKAINPLYDFFLVHVVTSSHAVRILLPMVPAKHQVSLIRQWWLLTLAVYVLQRRPEIHQSSIADYDVIGKDWDWVRAKAIEGPWSTDVHYVKALRALKEVAKTWGDKDGFYLKAAVKLCNEFDGWSGF